MEGTYGVVTLEPIIVKTAKPEEEQILISSETLMEVSILKHLNQSYIQDQLEYNPFPELYNAGVHINDNHQVISTIKMSNVGKSLYQIAVENELNSKEVCNLINFHLPNILRCVTIMHQNRVIHKDLTPKNIMIDNRNRIRIIDFGLSNFAGVPDGFHITRTIPGYQDTTSTQAHDIWILGASLVNLCLIDGEYIDPNDLMKIVKLIESHYPNLGSDPDDILNDMLMGELSVEIPIPDSIPQPLRHELQSMISIHPNDRSWEVEVVPPPPSWDLPIPSIDSTISNRFQRLVDNLLSRVSSSTQLTVAISILSRWFKNYGSIPDVELANKVLIGIQTIVTDEHLTRSTVGQYVNSEAPITELIKYQVMILKSIDGRVYNYHNTLQITDEIRRLIRVIKADSQRGSYFLFTEQQLVDRYRSLLNQ